MRYLINVLGSIGLIAVFMGPVFGQSIPVKEFIVEGEYDDVRFDLEDAIVSQGLKIDNISNVSSMLQRTADVVPGSKQIYTTGQQFQFCSAVLSRATMAADPANIAYCPHMIYVYQRVDEPGKVHIGYRKIDEVGSEASIKALKAVNKLLTDIITEASGN